MALGIDDPESWLASVSQRTLAVWEAFYMLEPWGQDYQRDAIISAQLSALSCSVAASHGAKQKPIPVQDFMPANWHRPPVQANENSIKAAEKVFAAKWGK